MYKINKEFYFSASHKLNGLPEAHPCSRLHGHNYVANFFFQTETLNDTGFVIDYRELEAIKNYIDNTFDHRHLNDILTVNPTAENIAQNLFEKFKPRFPQLCKVEISETPKTKAAYES